MRRSAWMALLLVTAAVAAEPPLPAPAPARPDAPAEPAVQVIAGSYTYRTYCASCHGADGKGEGPLAENLRFHPPDLTLIARRHGGEFPVERVHRIVDGRKPLPGHGGPDMPIWGDAFKNPETGFDDARVKEKVRGVVEYLRTMQAK